MTKRWRNRWIKAHDQAGGWAGRGTLIALSPRAEELSRLGMTAQQAGNVTAREYHLHSHARDLAELAGLN